MSNMSNINDKTGTPHTLNLADVLSEIELAPGQVSEFLRGLAYPHLGGAHDEMARALIQHANRVADPATYGAEPPPNPQAQWGTSAQGSPTPTSPVPASGAAQAQSAVPAFGTTNEPSWMADARAAGWTPEPSNAARAESLSDTPQQGKWVDARNPSSGRHYDESRGAWIDNATGQPVNVGSASINTPPQSAPIQ